MQVSQYIFAETRVLIKFVSLIVLRIYDFAKGEVQHDRPLELQKRNATRFYFRDREISQSMILNYSSK
jgi:hypothetical protein